MSRGFTLVELITVIMLLGILSAVAVARSFRTDDMKPRETLFTTAEQLRMARGLSTARFGETIYFSITDTAGTWSLATSSSSDGLIRQEILEADSLTLVITNGATVSTAPAGYSFDVGFSSSGEVASAALNGAPLQPASGIQLSVTGSSTHNLCIYPTGYIDNGSCD